MSKLGHVVVPCPVLTVASWSAYRFLRGQVRWSGIPIFLRFFHSLLWSTQSKALGVCVTATGLYIIGSLLSSLTSSSSLHCSVCSCHAVCITFLWKCQLHFPLVDFSTRFILPQVVLVSLTSLESLCHLNISVKYSSSSTGLQHTGLYILAVCNHLLWFKFTFFMAWIISKWCYALGNVPYQLFYYLWWGVWSEKPYCKPPIHVDYFIFLTWPMLVFDKFSLVLSKYIPYSSFIFLFQKWNKSFNSKMI